MRGTGVRVRSVGACMLAGVLWTSVSPSVAMAAPGVGEPPAYSVTVAEPEAACGAMHGATIRAAEIGTAEMLRSPATVTSAVYQSATDAVLTPDSAPVNNAGNSTAVVTPAKPAFCQLTGSIAPVTEGAQPIGFQINLPTEWNGSSVQFGGGGFNGRLIDATGYLPIMTNAGDVVTPLMRGYLTVSTTRGT